MTSVDSFKSRQKLVVGDKTYDYFSLKAAEANGLEGVSRLPYSLKVVLENLLRNEDGRWVTKDTILDFAKWLTEKGKSEREIAFRPARVLMQDFTGVPAVVDLAAMRDAMVALGRRSAEDQSAGAGRSRHRPFGHRRRIRHAQGLRAECRARISAQWRALPLPEMGPVGLRQFPRRAARHRHLPSGQSRISRPDRLDPRPRTASRSPIPTRWSAPIPTRPWSTASPCSAGASAASRRRPPCSASRSPCSRRRSSASS